MASHSETSGAAALRYAAALTGLAAEQDAIPKIESDMTGFLNLIAQSKDLQFFLRSPLIGVVESARALAEIADRAGFHPLTKNFLLTIAENRRLPETEKIMKAVLKNIAASRGEVSAKVQSAARLTDAQKTALADKLSQTIGRPVAIDETVNADLIGGVVVTLGSLMIDDSVKSKIERMGRGMKSRVA